MASFSDGSVELIAFGKPTVWLGTGSSVPVGTQLPIPNRMAGEFHGAMDTVRT